MVKILKFVILFCLTSQVVFAEDSFDDYSNRIGLQSDLTRNEGLAYMLSGGIALVGGMVGYGAADKPAEKGFFSVAQSLGLLAMGLGAEAYYVKSDGEIFLQVLRSGDLTPDQRDRMVKSYIREKKEQQEQVDRIRRIAFGTAGLLNIFYATQAQDQTLKNFLFVTATVEFVWAFNF